MSEPLSKEQAYARLGSITREMHEALTALGNNQLRSIVEDIPNARDRLIYVGKMTEDAANKVLTLVETSKPSCDDLAKRGRELGASLSRMAASGDLGVEKARGLLVVCGKFVDRSATFAEGQADALSDIMMAQDFQDLSGQVIKKVVDIINRTEMQLVQLLLDSSPDAQASTLASDTIERLPPTNEGATVDTHTLDGPQIAEKALTQNDVDDLLASLGF